MRKKFLSLALALTMVTSLVPTASVEAAKVKKPSLSQSKLSLEVGAKKTLKLKRAPKLSKKKIKKVKWSSSNSKVVRVSVRGKKRDKAIVTALSKGSATVKVKYNGKTYKCKVTVIGTGSTRRDTELVTEQLTEQPKTTEQEKTTEKPSNENTKPSEEKPTPHVHNYSDWKTVVTATCVKDGSEKRECSCGDKEIRTIKALGHQWDEGKITKAATYKEAGVRTFTCTACSETKTESIPMLTEDKHAWDNGVVTKEATCAEMGIRTYTCKNCGGTKTENIPVKIEHAWNAGVITKAATYRESGIKTYTCSVCGITKTEAIPMLTETEHKWDSGKVTTEPTCVKTGIKTYTCANCGGTKTEEVAVLAHTYGEGTVTKEATCAEAGTKAYTCSVCGNVKTEEIPATDNHDWKYKSNLSAPATCTEQGSKVSVCSVCNKTKTEILDALGHDYDEHHVCVRCEEGDATVYAKRVDVSNDSARPVYAYYKDSNTTDSSGKELYDVVVRPAGEANRIKAAAFQDDNTIRDVTFTSKTNGGTRYTGGTLRTYLASDASKMFRNCTNLRNVDVSGLCCYNATNMASLFSNSGLRKLTSDSDNFYFTGNSNYAFSGCKNLESVPDKITDGVASAEMIFQDCKKLKNATIECSGTMLWAFHGCDALESATVNGTPTNLDCAFTDCINLNLVKFQDVSRVTNFHGVFAGCTNLMAINWGKTGYMANYRATNLSYMFRQCTSLTSVDLSIFDTENVTTMAYMFDGCQNLASLNLSSFDTSSVTDMNYMFYNCSYLTSLDLSKFDTSNVTNMARMFQNCSKLHTIYVTQGKWNTSNADITDMFKDTSNCSQVTYK